MTLIIDGRSIAALVAHFYHVKGDDLECCLRRPAREHRAFDDLSLDEQLMQLRRVHEAMGTGPVQLSTEWPWNQIGASKTKALQLLRGQGSGAYVIRSSETFPDWFACASPVLNSATAALR